MKIGRSICGMPCERREIKLGFTDETLKNPTQTEDVEQWEVVHMVVAWIMNTIEPT